MGGCFCRPKIRNENINQLNLSIETSQWMSAVSDKCLTSDLSLPGTHESMSLYGGCWAQCQSSSLSRQYEAGIRFVDIRCRHFNDGLPIHHGIIYQHANFDDVLKATINFLDVHSTEIIFMRVKEEYIAQHNTTTFAEAVQIYVNRYPPDRLWCGQGFPIVSEARGKLVILRDYEDDGPATFGLPYSYLDIEDQWHIPSVLPKDIDNKWKSVRSHLVKAEKGPTTTMYLTYSSGASALACPCIVSRLLNTLLFDFFKGKARWGMVAMDFVRMKTIVAIIESNF